MVTVATKSQQSSEKSDLIQDLNKLLRFSKGQQEDVTGLEELNMTLAMASLKVVIQYLSLMSDAGNMGHYQLKQLNLKRFYKSKHKFDITRFLCTFFTGLFTWILLPLVH